MRVRDPGDRSAWEDFDRRYREWLLRFFRRRNVPFPDAEDLVQRVLANLAKSLPQFTYDPSRGRFRDYLFRCARNAIAEWANCPGRNGNGLINLGAIGGVAADGFDPAEAQAWEEEWISHHYRLALETLRSMASERDIRILERSVAGASVPDLAREFGMEEAAVSKVRYRIREKMEALIAAQIAEEDRTDG